VESWSVWPDGSLRGTVDVLADSTPSLWTPLDGIQITESESHPGWNSSFKKNFGGDRGGPFSSIRKVPSLVGVEVTGVKGFEPYSVSDGGGGAWSRYSGPILPTAPYNMSYADYSITSNDDLEELGTTAIARCAPTNPTSDASTFLGELIHEGIPRVTMSILKDMRLMSNRERRRAIGDQYLNYEFGWKPFVNDIRSIAGSVVHSHSVMKQYERDSGKLVRRRYDFPKQESVTSTVVSNPATVFTRPSVSTIYNRFSPGGQVIRTDHTVRRQWFSGAFSYYIPTGTSARDGMARAVIGAKKTLGISLTPDSIWKLTPWSWAVDWFSNAGDVLKNLDAWIIDNQVLMYGYMMEHCTITRTYTFVGDTGLKDSSKRPPSVSLVSESKVRIKATPYGFGFQWNGLSSFQKTIIAALGLSRS